MTGGVSLSAGRCARRATEAGLGCGASWAEREAERAQLGFSAGASARVGPGWGEAGPSEQGRGELGRAERVLGFLGAGLSIFLSYFLFFSFLNLIQTKFEFKFEFEFKPHSNKIMHQHECNKNLNL